MRTESKKHRKIIEELCSALNGKNFDAKGRRLKHYYPDVATENEDIEVEMLAKSQHIKQKSKGWDKTRKKILIIAVPDEILEVFDEIFLYDAKTFE